MTMTPNYAFEPSVMRVLCAPRARRKFAPAARDPGAEDAATPATPSRWLDRLRSGLARTRERGCELAPARKPLEMRMCVDQAHA